MLSRTLSMAALIGFIGSSTAFAGSSGRPPSSGIKVGSPKAGRLESSVTKKLTDTTNGPIIKIGRTVIQGRMAQKPGTAPVRRGTCEEWGCGSTNGTKLTGLVQETVEATEAVVTSVMLPSGETIDLR